jgi:uncharacterized protein YycO
MRGDILLFYSSGKLPDRFVAWASKGPFVHVAVDMGNGTNIAAHPRGVGMELNPSENVIVRVPVAKGVDPHVLAEAITWLHDQVGKPYGWFQILDYGLGVLGLPVYFFVKGHNDCSTLVAKYLCRINPDDCFDEPDLISPNDLARRFHVI